MVRGSVDLDKWTNIKDLVGKIKAKKPKVLGLSSFKQAKCGIRQFDNEKPHKE